MYRYNKQKRRSWLKILIISLLVVGLLTIGTIVTVRKYYQDNLKPLSSQQSFQEITIQSGASLSEISNLLHDNKIVRNSWVFERYVVNNGASTDIKAGTYELSPSYSVPEIVSIITEGKIASNLVTIAPGANIEQIKRALKNSGYSDQEVADALSPANYTDHPALVDKPKDASLEGYLYPESFQRTSATKATSIITQSLDEMQKRLTPMVREQFANQGLSVHRAITLASLVEREVSSDQDRRQVAQVFIARLNKGMQLQSNATDSLPDEYDTYKIDGLPPGPISNVTESSINAVAQPAGGDYLYFVSGTDCVTRFSRTVQEHDALKDQFGVATPADNCS